MHAGFNGLLKSAMRGIPVVTIPIFADQQRNAKMAEYRGFGIVVEKTNLEGPALKTAIQTILTNPIFIQKAKRISHLIKRKLFKPDAIFVKWIKFVAKNGQLPELTPEGVSLGWFEYYCLNLIFVWFLFVLIVLLLVFYFARKVLSSTVNNVKAKKE